MNVSLKALNVAANITTFKNDYNEETTTMLVSKGDTVDLKINHENVANTNVLLKGSGDIVASFLNCGNVVSELRGSGDITFSGDVRSLTNSQLGSGDYHINRLNIKH